MVPRQEHERCFVPREKELVRVRGYGVVSRLRPGSAPSAQGGTPAPVLLEHLPVRGAACPCARCRPSLPARWALYGGTGRPAMPQARGVHPVRQRGAVPVLFRLLHRDGQYLLDQRIPACELVTVGLATPAEPPAPVPGRTGRKNEEPAQPTRLLLVEDDEAIREALRLALTRQGYEVLDEGTGRAGLRSAYLQRPDLVLLDVMLPDIDGMEVLRRLRTVSDVPVIYLTARSDPIDVIVGLETGADDYIVKPCQAREIDARIRRVLYRYRAAERRDGDVYDDGLLRLDSLQQQAWAAGVPLPLSRTEFRILDRLVRHTGAVQHFGTLLEAGWGAASPGARDRVKFTVSRLRGKLDATPVGGGSIVSVRGMGYLYRSPTTPALPPSPKPAAASTGYGHTHALHDGSRAQDRAEQK